MDVDPSESLLSLSSQLLDAEDDLSETRHTSLLRRRFMSIESHAVLAAGLNGGDALLAGRRAQTSRIRQNEELEELKAKYAEAKAQAERESARATMLEDQLQLLAESKRSLANAETLSAAPIMAPPTPMPTVRLTQDVVRAANDVVPNDRHDDKQCDPADVAVLQELIPDASDALCTYVLRRCLGKREAALEMILTVELSELETARAEASKRAEADRGEMAATPRVLVDELHHTRLEAVGGVGGGTLMALVGRALQALSRDLYSGAGAVLGELMQNADDARYALGTTPSLRIRLTHGSAVDQPLGLLVETNECGFRESDVRAICDLGASAKVRIGTSAATGRKGLGFKSVFAVCDTPHVRSNGYSWRFDVRGEHGLYGALVPIWVEPVEMNAALPPDATRQTGTTLWLPLRGGAPPPMRVAPSTLLFLRRLRVIELDRPADMGGPLTLRRLSDAPAVSDKHALTNEGGTQLERVVIAIDREGRVEVREYLVWHETPLIGGQPTEIALAFREPRSTTDPAGGSPSTEATTNNRDDANGCSSTSAARDGSGSSHAVPSDLECDVHAWLPVTRVGLPFLVQADWELVASREKIHDDAPRNVLLRDACLAALLRAVRSEQSLAERIDLWLPSTEQCHEPFWRPLFDVAQQLRAVPMLRAEGGGLVAPQDAVLRELPPVDASMDAPIDGAVRAIEPMYEGGEGTSSPGEAYVERVSPLLVSGAWLAQAMSGKRFVEASHVSQLGLGVLTRLGCMRFTVETFIEMMGDWATLHTSTPTGIPVGCDDEARGVDGRAMWLREAHSLLHRHMRAEHVRTVRALPILELADEHGGTLVATSSRPPLFHTHGCEVSSSLCALSISSAAVRLLSPRNHATREQRALLSALGIEPLHGAAIVHAIAQQHAAAAPELSLDGCWAGLALTREFLLAFLTDEAARAHRGGESASSGAHAALQWLCASILVPCTDGCLRAPTETFSRSLLGLACPTCSREGPRGARRQELPPRLLATGAAGNGRRVRAVRNVEPLSRRQSSGMVRPTSLDGVAHASASGGLSVRETFEVDRSRGGVAGGGDGGRQMMNAVRCASFTWSTAISSASVATGRVCWAAAWKCGELALGVGILTNASSENRTPGHGRYALAVMVAADGTLSVSYASTSSSVSGPPLQAGDSLVLALDATVGVLYVATRSPGEPAVLRQLSDSTPLRQRDTVKRSTALPGYTHASFFDDEGSSPADAPHDPDGTGRAAIAIPSELYMAELYPTIAMRRRNVEDHSTANADSTSFEEITDGIAPCAEAMLQFGAQVGVPSLQARGFRPLSLALAAQRSGGRHVPLVAPPPVHLPSDRNFPRTVGIELKEPDEKALSSPDEDRQLSWRVVVNANGAGGSCDVNSLAWEGFLALLGAKGHLEEGGCCAAGWWAVVQQSEPSQLRGLECAVCCDALVSRRCGTPEPGLEAVGTTCGHRFHSKCILRWLATAPATEELIGRGGVCGPCPVCRADLEPKQDVKPLGSDPATIALTNGARMLISMLSPSTRPAPTPPSSQTASDRATSSDKIYPKAAVAAAEIIGSQEAIAECLLRKYASEPRAASGFGCTRLPTPCGLVPLADTILAGSAVPQLRACKLPLPYLNNPPPRKHHSLLDSLGCAAVPGLTSDIKALKALATALAVPGATKTVGVAACRTLLLSAYAAVEASLTGDTAGGEGSEVANQGRHVDRDGANTVVALERAAAGQVRAAFATQPLLWGGDSIGFRTIDQCLAGAPASAAALLRADPIPLFPELPQLMTVVLAVPKATEALCMDALRAVAFSASITKESKAADRSLPVAANEDAAARPLECSSPPATAITSGSVVEELGDHPIALDTTEHRVVRGAVTDASAARQVLEEFDCLMRADAASLDVATVALHEADGVMWLLAEALPEGAKLTEQNGVQSHMVRVSKARPLIMRDEPALGYRDGFGYHDSNKRAQLFADVWAFEPAVFSRLVTTRLWLEARELLVPASTAILKGDLQVYGKLRAAPEPFEHLATTAFEAGRARHESPGDAEAIGLLRVRVCDRIRRSYRLQPPPTVRLATTQQLPIHREMPLPWCLRRQVASNTVTIVLSESAGAKLLESLAEALDMLLAADAATAADVTEHLPEMSAHQEAEERLGALPEADHTNEDKEPLFDDDTLDPLSALSSLQIPGLSPPPASPPRVSSQKPEGRGQDGDARHDRVRGESSDTPIGAGLGDGAADLLRMLVDGLTEHNLQQQAAAADDEDKSETGAATSKIDSSASQSAPSPSQPRNAQAGHPQHELPPPSLPPGLNIDDGELHQADNGNGGAASRSGAASSSPNVRPQKPSSARVRCLLFVEPGGHIRSQ